MITIIDYKVGNLGSILNMLKKIGLEAQVTYDKEIIGNASKLILPGVGSYDTGMKNLNELGLVDVLNYKVEQEKIPILGICLGMQLLTRSSEEGNLKGLGWINGTAKRFSFPSKTNFKVPHMGWNYVYPQKDSMLFKDMYEEPRFYFVHSYYVTTAEEYTVLTKTEYGIEFCSAVEKDNIYGVQFHPEKSHKFGFKLLKNFYEL